MKMKTCRLLGIMTAIILVSSQVWSAQIVSKTNDASVAFRVYNGYTGTLTWVVGNNTDTTVQTNTVTCDGNSVSMLSTGALVNTIYKMSTNAIVKGTNESGTASLIVNAEPSLGGDSIVGTLLPRTYTASAGTWLEVLWDTSVCKFYSLYLPSRTYQTGVAPYVLGAVRGDPAGSGNVTASIYKGGILIDQRVYTAPVYVNPAVLYHGGTTPETNTLGVVQNVTLDWNLDMPFSGIDAVIVRVLRASGATNGVINAVIPTI